MSKDLRKGTKVDHPKYGEGIISDVSLTSYKIIFSRGGEMQFSKSVELDVLEEAEEGETSGAKEGLTLEEVEEVMVSVLEKYNGLQEVIPLGGRWEGGKMLLQPADLDQKPKEIPIESFFHKIVMLRDRLRVLEQNINSHEKLSDEDKVHMQQYISRAYGSLTTFNILFKEKEHNFKGSGGK